MDKKKQTIDFDNWPAYDPSLDAPRTKDCHLALCGKAMSKEEREKMRLSDLPKYDPTVDEGLEVIRSEETLIEEEIEEIHRRLREAGLA